MLIFKEGIVTEKEIEYEISGVDSNYKFFSRSKLVCVKHIKGENVICILSARSLKPIETVFKSIGYYKDISTFLNSKFVKETTVHDVFLKWVEDEDEANKIISDISNNHDISSLDN